ncbi:PEP-CTERM sorting domain-containing protein [Roseisolibacter sp. H3M3-2]|uniref:PEP-CTERM sorting domain-containing protein n=1 Tax=Roseisolibacter sp. H3M3-2 TaxID=3031323 RepID=UPI0023DC1E9D|nr:PEP-CTERM sorting domain-containing protein [Roseisolibacter sp. H3M3-2]MDF1501631.1 PEP-CTERM sorting domain-containing protein [Roseisolibacter sp. H3M3-2]
MPVLRHARRLSARSLLAVALALPGGTLAGQGQIDVSSATLFTSRSQFLQTVTGGCQTAFSDLNNVADGGTVIPLREAQGCIVNTIGGSAPWSPAVLGGATVQGGQITSATPFTITFPGSSGQLPQGFGADFRLLGGGTDLLFLTFSGINFAPFTRTFLLGESTQFLGARVPSRFQQVTISTQGNTTVVVDNFAVLAPEPSTYALLGTGLLALGGVAARRRRG